MDDVALCRKFHSRLLEMYSRELVEAGDGQEAVDKVREAMAAGTPFDGILMDACMSVMDGLAAATEIRRLGFTGKIFGITGNGYQSDIDAFEAHGADEVLVKPLSMDKYAYICSASMSIEDEQYVL